MQNETVPRLTRRVIGLLATKSARLDFEGLVREPRTKTGNIKYSMRKLLTANLVGMASGKHGFGEVQEQLTSIGLGARRALNLPARIADTTMRDTLVRLDHGDLRKVLHAQNKLAFRAKQYRDDLPIKAICMDGKFTATFLADDAKAKVKYAQLNSATGNYRVGTITVCKVSTPARPCLDAVPIPAATNEMGFFPKALDIVLGAYGHDVTELVMYDAGACSLANAGFVRERGLQYLFCLRDNQPELLAEAQRLLGRRQLDKAMATSTALHGSDVVTRHLWATSQMVNYNGWLHANMVLRVRCVCEDKTTGAITTENRYYISSLKMDRLAPGDWLTLLVRRWSVENQNHNTWDRLLLEDKRPWMKQPNGMLVEIVIRRIAYNILAVFRSVTTRAETKRATPWKQLMQSIADALVRATYELLVGVRKRSAVTS